MFEKRRDHGAHRIVSVPETSFFLRAAPTGAKEETQKEMHERHSCSTHEREREREEKGEKEAKGARQEGLKRDTSRERDGKLEKERKMRRLKEGGKKS